MGRGDVVILWWLVGCVHVGANLLVDRYVPEWMILFLTSFHTNVGVWSVVQLDALGESGVDVVDPRCEFRFRVLGVVVAGFAPVDEVGGTSEFF